jgi:flagellar basal-body rod protein FlgC
MSMFETLRISAAGMKAQSDRLNIVSQNIANAESTGTRPGELPYRRQTISFGTVFDREVGADMVQTKRIGTDPSQFPRRFDPSHPAADAQGYVQFPNVNSIVEMMDMREARRGYEANLNVIETTRNMLSQTLGLLR